MRKTSLFILSICLALILTILNIWLIKNRKQNFHPEIPATALNAESDYIIVALIMNIGLALSNNSDIQKSILTFNDKKFAGSEGTLKIYTKTSYNCYKNGDDSSFNNWCNSSWHCTSGTDYKTCQEGPACSPPCEEIGKVLLS